MQNKAATSIELATFVTGLNHRNSKYCDFHSHPYMEILYQSGGIGATHLADNSTCTISTDSVVIYWPEVKHNQIMKKLGVDVCIILSVSDIDWLPENRKWVTVNLENKSFLKREILSLAKIPSSRNPIQQKIADLRVTALLMDLIDLVMEEERSESLNRKVPHHVAIARDYIHDNYDTVASVADVASHVGISYDYLRHQFSDAYGISMKQYLLKIRIEQAAQYLTYSPLPLKCIAQECGFDNERYFSTSFKLHTGSTPGEYRKKHSEI